MTPTASNDLRKQWGAAFRNVMNKYASIKQSHSDLIKNGRKTEDLDFVTDVDMRIKRILPNGDYKIFTNILGLDPGEYMTLPPEWREALGRQFLEDNLIGVYLKKGV